MNKIGKINYNKKLTRNVAAVGLRGGETGQ